MPPRPEPRPIEPKLIFVKPKHGGANPTGPTAPKDITGKLNDFKPGDTGATNNHGGSTVPIASGEIINKLYEFKGKSIENPGGGGPKEPIDHSSIIKALKGQLHAVVVSDIVVTDLGLIDANPGGKPVPLGSHTAYRGPSKRPRVVIASEVANDGPVQLRAIEGETEVQVRREVGRGFNSAERVECLGEVLKIIAAVLEIVLEAHH